MGLESTNPLEINLLIQYTKDMSDFNRIYELLGQLQSDVSHVKETTDEIKSEAKATRIKVERHEKIINRAFGYCIAAGLGIGGMISYIPKTLANLFK